MQPQRDMSYRKPVPIYVPSPLPSPPPSPRIPPHGSVEGFPPLPENWRELVQQATTIPLEESTSQSESLEDEDVESQKDFSSNFSSVQAFNPAFRRSNLNNTGSDVVIQTTPARTISLSSYNQERRYKKRLCQHYRPPTPPLPSVQRQNSPSDGDMEYYTNTGVYVDTSRHYLGLYPNSSWRAGASLFSATPSVQTERTLVTFNTERSKGWTHGSTTPSDGAMYSSPALAAKEHSVNDMHRVACDLPTATCWEGLSLWVKQLVCK